ncbi:LysR substrate-binding domain-containing protein [Vibrio ziniensis]|uniref:LysR family transcriptional regulator n=1 Tax=Vibrio ziniensis TaxID=2711221 RepID=A0A6G7CPA2_9VIBR|nr:LysR substrate-binding domain-containing protein [Vibrio ziniensis]QIH43876.1 LysR family transcriptional regulator [Vibrio ziniensis]
MPIKTRSIPATGHLIAFETTARLGSLSLAADELCVTTAAISKQIKSLEQFLNTELFIRSAQGMRLTENGEQYLSDVTQALNHLSQCTAKFKQRSEETKNEITIELGPCFLHFWLLPRLEIFREKYPNIMINISVNSVRDIEDGGNYDVAFFYSSISSRNSHTHIMFKERMFLVCSPKFLNSRTNIDVKTSAIFDHPIIMMSEEHANWEGWESWAMYSGITYRKPKNILRVEDQVAVIQAAINNAGIALVWDWQVDDLITKGQLIAISSPLDLNDNAYFLATTARPNSQAAATFSNWLIAESQQ